jgi:DNA-binding MarR family transcriptional regulator
MTLMRIEEAIQQSRFKDEWHKATVNLMYTNNWLVDKIKSALKKEGVTMQQYNVLRILRGSHPRPISTASIRDRMLDKMSDASRIVDRLVKKGWVERSTCEQDKRLVDVVITQQGLDLLAQIDRDRSEIELVLSQLSEEEAQTLNQLLDKIRE